MCVSTTGRCDGTTGVGVFGWVLVERVASWKICANSVSVVCWLSDKGEENDGCKSAWIKSLAAAVAASNGAADGIVTCVGNQARVSAMRSALVAVAYTRCTYSGPMQVLDTSRQHRVVPMFHVCWV
jgi:hypothetical protein